MFRSAFGTYTRFSLFFVCFFAVNSCNICPEYDKIDTTPEDIIILGLNKKCKRMGKFSCSKSDKTCLIVATQKDNTYNFGHFPDIYFLHVNSSIDKSLLNWELINDFWKADVTLQYDVTCLHPPIGDENGGAERPSFKSISMAIS